MKIARLHNDGKLLIKGEVVEYPLELKGGRNLLSTSFEKYDFGVYAYIELVKEDTEMILKLYDRDSSIDMSGIYFGFTGVGYSAEGNVMWSMNNGDLQRDEIVQSGYRYFSFYPGTEAIFNKIFDRFYIKIEKGNKATSWTPSPEDLGLIYSDDIQSFTTGFRNNGDLLVGEFIEYPFELNGKRNLISESIIGTTAGSTDTSEYSSKGVIKFSTSHAYGGLYITAHPLLPNTEYVMSYRYKKTSGTLVSFGGHTDPSWNNTKAYVDGVGGGRYSAGSSVFVSDDNLEHEVVIYINTPSEISVNHKIEIQPNRGSATPVDIDIYDLKLVEGMANGSVIGIYETEMDNSLKISELVEGGV